MVMTYSLSGNKIMMSVIAMIELGQETRDEV